MSTILERLRHDRNVGEAAGLLLMLLALLLLLSLASYHSNDASYWFNPQAADRNSLNWFGRVGATLSEALLQLFGTAAFLFPFALADRGWRRLRPDEEETTWTAWVGYLALGLSLCSVLHLLFGYIAFRGETFPAGGFVGEKTANLLKGLFNTAGALLVSLAALVSVLILTTSFSLARFGKLASRGGQAAWRHARSSGLRLFESWRNRSSARQPASPEPEIAPQHPAATSPSRSIELPAAAAATPKLAEPTGAPRKKRKIRPAPKQAALPMEPGQRGYRLPPADLLNEPPPQTIESEQELLERARNITEKLQEFAVHGAVVAIHPGPVVTTFEFKPEAGVKYSKITGMTDDLSLALKAESVRIDRMHGRATVGVEVPNRQQETIFPRELLTSERFCNSPSPLTLALGKDISGDVFTADLDRMPHLLIAGATGAGKSVGINGMIASILYKATPDKVRFIMIDTKMIELGIYAEIPHLLIPVVTEPKQASTALKWACREMEARYRKLATIGVRNIAQFNAALAEDPERTMDDPKTGEPLQCEPLPYIVIVIDELADLMMVSSSDVEESIMRLAQMARAVGIHLIVATQRPSVDVITGTIKANFPARIAFRVSQRVDSRTIIDRQGAEHLLGRGDMLFIPPGSSQLLRLHGAYITEPELNRITAYIKKMAEPIYDKSVLDEGPEGPGGVAGGGARDEMYERAVRTVIQEGKCSITLIQRRLQLGYARAARIVDMMEQEGVVSAGEGSKPREILVGPEFVDNLEAGG